MSQYSYTKKPNFLADSTKNMSSTIMSTVQAAIFPTYKGWMSPSAGIGFSVGSTLVWSASVVTVTTLTAHNLITGGYAMITGVTPAAYNGYFPVTVTGLTTFTYPLTSNPGTALVAQTVTAQSWYNGVLTLTVPSHGFQASDFQTVLAGFVPTAVNGSTEVDVVDANTVSISMYTNPIITTLGTIKPQASIYVNAEVLVAIGQLDQLFGDSAVLPTFSATILYSNTLNTVTNDFITVAVTSSEPIIVTGTPTITLSINGVVHNMVFRAVGSSQTVLYFDYGVIATDHAIAGQVVVGSSITGQLGIGDILTPIGTVSGALNPLTSATFTPPTTSSTTVN